MAEPIISTRTLLLVGLALLALAALTVGLDYVDLGPWSTPAALVIAGGKAVLVALYFMQVRYSSGMTRLVVIAGLLWLGILLAGILDDVLTRGWLPIPGK